MILVIVLALVAFLFYVWRSFISDRAVPTSGISRQISPFPLVSGAKPAPPFLVEPSQTEEILSLAPSQIGAAARDTAKFFSEQFGPIIPPAFKNFPQEEYFQEEELFINSLTSEVGETPPSLSEKEVFETLYPKFYIEYLKGIEAEFIAEGVIQTHSNFATEKEIKDFLLLAGNYFLSQKLIDQNGYEALRQGISFVFDAAYSRKLQEALALRQSLRATIPKGAAVSQKDREEFLNNVGVKNILGTSTVDALPEYSSPPVSSCVPPPARLALWTPVLETLQLLLNAYSVQSAEARGPTFCITPPYCFLPGVPLPLGSNLITPCCMGMTRGVGIGCFELCDFGSRPFIWDGMTGICGCG